MRLLRLMLFCAATFATTHQRLRQQRHPTRRTARFVLAALPLLGWSGVSIASAATTQEQGASATVLVGGYAVTSDVEVDWTVDPSATIGLVGRLDDLESTAVVVMLPLAHATMTVEEWATLGIDPIAAAQMSAALQPTESLSIALDLNGQVLSIVVTSQCQASSSSTFIVSTRPQSVPETIEEMLERLRRMLQDLRDMLHPVPPSPPAGGGPGDEDPNGDL